MSKLLAEEQGFWFASGVVLLTILLTIQNYHGPHEEALHIVSVVSAMALGWVVRDELCNPHWEDVPMGTEDKEDKEEE